MDLAAPGAAAAAAAGQSGLAGLAAGALPSGSGSGGGAFAEQVAASVMPGVAAAQSVAKDYKK